MRKIIFKRGCPLIVRVWMFEAPTFLKVWIRHCLKCNIVSCTVVGYLLHLNPNSSWISFLNYLINTLTVICISNHTSPPFNLEVLWALSSPTYLPFLVQRQGSRYEDKHFVVPWLFCQPHCTCTQYTKIDIDVYSWMSCILLDSVGCK